MRFKPFGFRGAAAPVAAAAVAALLAVGGPASPARAQIPPEQWQKTVEGAVKKGCDYLFSLQKNTVRLYFGTPGKITDVKDIEAEWKDVVIVKDSTTVKVKGTEYKDVLCVLPPGWFGKETLDNNAGHIAPSIGGESGLILLALITAGESGMTLGFNPSTDKRIAKGIESAIHMHSALPKMAFKAGDEKEQLVLQNVAYGTYATGIRCCVLEAAMRTFKTGETNTNARRSLEKEAKRLELGYFKDGGYNYPNYPMTRKEVTGRWDLSNTQYGILGLWAAARAGVELSDKTWEHFNTLLLERQARDGGWDYCTDNHPVSLNMTAAGLASMFVIMDLLHTKTRGANKPDITPFNTQPLLFRTLNSIDKGMDWWGREWKYNGEGYTLYGTERVGFASGYKYFGDHNWFKEGAEGLIKSQQGDGSWNGGHGPTCNTPWNIMFLVYGNAPILINKLQYGKKGDWTWHNYPRDAANVARWFSHAREYLVGWQIISLDPNREEDLLDAPVVYVSGHEELPFDDAQVDILRRYVEKGGTLLFVANAGSKKFIDSVLKLGQRMYPPEKYPEFQFTAVEKTHPLYRDLKPTDPIIKNIRLMHMSNGHRSFAFLAPDDINHTWQGNKHIAKKENFQFWIYLTAYATDRTASLPAKIRPGPLAGVPRAGQNRGSVKVAVASYTSKGIVSQGPIGAAPKQVAVKSDWATTPAAWPAFNVWAQHAAGLTITEGRGLSLTDPELKSYDVIHLSGHYAPALTEAEEKVLQEFVNGGGAVLIDTPGGAGSDFTQAMSQLMRKLFPGEFTRLPANSPLVTGSGLVGETSGSGISRQLRLLRDNVAGPQDVCSAVIKKDGRVAVLLCTHDLSVGISGQASPDRLGLSFDGTRKLVANFLAQAKGARAAAAPANPPAGAEAAAK